MLSLWRWLLQIFLLATVAFFGFHYFTRPELHSCVSIPLASLQGKTTVNLDQQKVDIFMDRFTHEMRDVASRSGTLMEHLSSVETPAEAEGDLRTQLLDRGQYLYCKAVIDKVEQSENTDSSS